MLNAKERELIYEHAYLPEHLPDYVGAVSGSEPFLHQDHLCFFQKGHLTFIGYPLGPSPADTEQAYASACDRFRPATAVIIGPRIWLDGPEVYPLDRDTYYFLDLPAGPPDPEVAYMVRRAARELRVVRGTFGREHRRMVRAFVSNHALEPEQKVISRRIPRYLKRSSTAHPAATFWAMNQRAAETPGRLKE